MASDNTYISESPMMKDNLVVVISAADTIRTEEIDVTNPNGFMSPLGGGFMEIVRPVGLRGSDLVMVVDDNGLSKNLRENRAASALYRNTIVGDVVICPEIDTIEGPDLACFSREMAEAFISKIMEQAPYLTRENNQEKTMEDVEEPKVEESVQQNEKEKDPIFQFRGENSFLSNFYSHVVMPLNLDDVNGNTYNFSFTNTEAMFQGFKVFKDAFGDHTPEEMEKLREFSQMTAKEARAAGRKITPFDGKYWDSVKDQVMEMCLDIKFSNPELRAKLLATGTRQLIEGNSYGDTYWGTTILTDESGNAIGADSKSGNNKLGKLLMKVRDGLVRPDTSIYHSNEPKPGLIMTGYFGRDELQKGKEELQKEARNYIMENRKENTEISKLQNTGNTRSKYSFRDTGKYFTIVAPTPDSVTPEQKETFSAIIKAFSDLGYTPRINSSKNNEGLIPKGVNYVLVGKKTQMTKEALSSLDKYSPESDEIHRQSCAEKHVAIMGDGKSARSDFVLICSSEGKLGPALHTAIIAEDPAVNIPVFDIGRKDKAGVLVDYQALRDAFSNVKRGASVIDAVRRQSTGLHSGPEKVYSRYVNPEVASEKQNDRAFENMSRSELWNHVFRESSLHPVHGSSPVHERVKNPYSLDTTDPTVSVNEWTFQMPEDYNSAALDSEIVVPSRVKITELPRNQYVWLPDTDDDLIELNADMNYAEDGVSRNTDVVALADVTEYETLTTRGQLEAYMKTLNVDRDGISNDTVARFFSPIDRRNENGDRFYSHEELIAMEIMNDGDTWSNIKNEYFGNDFGNENSAREYSESENIIEM